MVSFKASLAAFIFAASLTNADDDGYSDCDETLLGRINLNPTQIAGIMFNDRAGTFGNGYEFMYSGEHDDLDPIDWNDKMSSITIKYGFACALYNHDNFGGCMQIRPKLSQQKRGGAHFYYINSWDNILSSYKCGRLCTKKQARCAAHDWSNCADMDTVACETPNAGYLVDDDGWAYVDPDCVSISVEITDVAPTIVADKVAESVNLAQVSIDNCDHDVSSFQTVSTTDQVWKSTTNTYTREEGWEDTFSHSYSQDISVSYKTGVAFIGWEFEASFGFEQTFTGTESGSQAWSEQSQNKSVQTWQESFTFEAPAYTQVNYTSVGSKRTGEVTYEAIATCLDVFGNPSTAYEPETIKGSFRGAIFTSKEVLVESKDCGMNAAYDYHENTFCDNWAKNEDGTDLFYDALMDAQVHCEGLGDECAGVYDEWCDDLLWRVCVVDNNLKESTAGSCVWTPKQGDVRRMEVDVTRRQTVRVRDLLKGNLKEQVASGDASRSKRGDKQDLLNKRPRSAEEIFGSRPQEVYELGNPEALEEGCPVMPESPVVSSAAAAPVSSTTSAPVTKKPKRKGGRRGGKKKLKPFQSTTEGSD